VNGRGAAPGISVVIPTRDSNELLPELLRTLNRARVELGRPHEVIVVDDSEEESRAELERLCALNHVRLVRGGRHVGGKRNLGAAAARFDILLFVDSDCRASVGLLREHWAAHALPGVGACAGPVRFIGRKTWLWPGVVRGGHVDAFQLPARLPRLVWSPTANLSVRRACFEAVGGFDESSPRSPGGEDMDLGVRLTECGFAMHTNPRALVWHDRRTWSSLRGMVRRMARYGRAEAWVIERHPGRTRRLFPGHLALLAGGLALWLAVGFPTGCGAAALPLVWLTAYVLTWLGWSLREGPPRRVLPGLATAALLQMAFEAGQIAGCCARRHPAWAFRTVVFGPAGALRIAGRRRAWSWCAASLVAGLVWILTGR
jgi:glycosyltransferase involved in cell wall biosynthesis